MAYTSADLEKLERAIASGVMTVRHGDTQVTYQTLDEMQRAYDRIKAAVQASSGSGRKRFSLAAISRG